jgi:hypothetical protein
MPNDATLIHLKDGTPAAPSGFRNVKWQQGAPYNTTAVFNGETINIAATDVSSYVPNIGGVDTQAGTTYTVAAADQGKLVDLTNAASVAVSLDSSVPTGFLCGCLFQGAAGGVLTPTSGTINGSASQTLAQNQGGLLFFNGTNWWLLPSSFGSGGTGTVTHTSGALTAHAVILGNGSADIKAIASLGTAGQVLISGGAGSDPTWGSVGGASSAAPYNSMLAPASVTPPVLGSLTWGNQGGATAAANAGNALYVSGTGAGGDNIRHLYVAAPGTPWTFTIGVVPGSGVLATFNIAGICIRDSGSGKIIAMFCGAANVGQPWVDIFKYNSYTSASASYIAAITTSSTVGWNTPVCWMQLTDDGANYTWRISIDGQNFKPILVKSRTDFLTTAANQIGICINTIASTYLTDAVFVHWAGI